MSEGCRPSIELRRTGDKVEAGERALRIAGLLLMLAGWMLVLSALILLPATSARSAFLVAGFVVDLIGLGLAMRPPPAPLEERA